MRTRRALLSVSDKRGMGDFARGLKQLGFEILSTGGTAQLLQGEQIPVTPISEYTGSPEILGGRVKTLHPRIHGALLGRRDHPTDLAEMEAQGIQPIELVVVNLYPFEEAVARGAPASEVIEQIDIGGPSMIRSAAKNAAFVAVVVDPLDYAPVLAALREHGEVPLAQRRALQAKAFLHTAGYDQAIAAYFAGEPDALPEKWLQSVPKAYDLRYGENPHQKAALYRATAGPQEPSIPFAEVLQGKELSYNNLLDLDSALSCLKELDETAAVIVKHNTPCGVAQGGALEQSYRRARACDEVSAFGGIVALNRPVDGATAAALGETFLECVVAPAFSPEAREALAGKKNLRLLEARGLEGPRAAWKRGGREARTILGGLLVQDRDLGELGEVRCVTARQPTGGEMAALRFAWKVVKHVRSNAIVFAREGRTVAIGGGQTSRVEAVKLAAMKASLPLAGSAVASDAFFPFRDGLDACARAGATACIQPGGSLRDSEVIQAADEQNVAMVLTGMRHFRH